ncbi:hypothetical protein ACSNOJ_10175 [Streptomyces sp. URMC 128]|uniref:hypothetical protein n=1 Tax=Streptomyces sp. URMC 128 TaxID=3423404 RepID=UPI003F1D60C3
MAADLHRDDALLLVDDQQIAVEVDFGLFLPDKGSWGGVLRRVPEWVAGAVKSADEVRLRLSSGHERRIRPLAVPDDEISVPFVGEGTAPF